jgi:RNA polymerase sigma-70 factor (ECF subfamily)
MNQAINPEQLNAERKALYLYAMVRLRDPGLAEDVVQETLVAALETLSRFEGRSSLRTWLIAILRNKMCDLMRDRQRLVFAEPRGGDDGDADPDFESLFDGRGNWRDDRRPRDWEDPRGALEQREFWQVFEACLGELPIRTAEVFVLREVLGEPIEAVCGNLGITENNCSVMLYRARMRLRGCLEAKWFAGRRQS